MTREVTPLPATASNHPAQPFLGLRNDVARVFDGFLRDWPDYRPGTSMFTGADGQTALSPDIDVYENEDAYEIVAELPGIDEKQIDVSLKDRVLTLKGEKTQDREEKTKSYYMTERRYGRFQRAFTLPDDVAEDKIATKFAKGVLTINLPKSPESKAKARKIAVRAG